jgi:hypothetical protein
VITSDFIHLRGIAASTSSIVVGPEGGQPKIFQVMKIHIIVCS